jgi:hypothetical protein
MTSRPDGTNAERKLVKSGTPLDCTCPHCRASLIDGDQIVLDVEREDQESGTLLLNPQLNVFDCSSTIELPDGVEVADLRCSRCRGSLRETDTRCGECGSHAARILIVVDGEASDFFICLRKGCHWHDISQAARSRLILEAVGYHRPDRPREMIQSGTKLECACPHCLHIFTQGEDLVLSIKTPSGQWGELSLSPILNDFRSKATVQMDKGAVAADIACLSCAASLLVHDHPCRLCGAPTARFHVKTSKGPVDFFACSRRQCHWHGLDETRKDLDLEPG